MERRDACLAIAALVAGPFLLRLRALLPERPGHAPEARLRPRVSPPRASVQRHG